VALVALLAVLVVLVVVVHAYIKESWDPKGYRVTPITASSRCDSTRCARCANKNALGPSG
jgi:hypothetical protein